MICLRNPVVSTVSKSALSLLIAGFLLVQAGQNPAIAEDDDWMNFGSSSSSASDWEQPFDRSFAKQWENNPQRGYPTLSKRNIATL